MTTEEIQQQAPPTPTTQQMEFDHYEELSQEASASSLHDIVPESQMRPETYQFPSERLRRRQRYEGKEPIVLVACGSFRCAPFAPFDLLVQHH